MTSREYQVAMMLLFIGFISMQIPSNIYLTRGRPSIYLPVCMTIWGAISALGGVVHNAAGLYAIRFFLGIFEAPFCVGCLFLISSWYTRAEMGLRSAFLLSAPMFAHAFCPIVAAAISQQLDGARGIDDWRFLYIIGGAVTVVVAIFAAFILPDFPSNTRWLSEEERIVAQWRMVCDVGQVDANDQTWQRGLRTTFTDLKVWVFAFMFLFLAIGASLHNFFPSVVETLGFGKTTTLWLSAPPYVLGMFMVVLNSWHADHVGNASFYIIALATVATIGFFLFIFLETGTESGKWARYAATFLMIAGAHAANPIVLAWTQKTLLRPRVKRAGALAVVNATGAFSQVCRMSILVPINPPSSPIYALQPT